MRLFTFRRPRVLVWTLDDAIDDVCFPHSWRNHLRFYLPCLNQNVPRGSRNPAVEGRNGINNDTFQSNSQFHCSTSLHSHNQIIRELVCIKIYQQHFLKKILSLSLRTIPKVVPEDIICSIFFSSDQDSYVLLHLTDYTFDLLYKYWCAPWRSWPELSHVSWCLQPLVALWYHKDMNVIISQVWSRNKPGKWKHFDYIIMIYPNHIAYS